MQLETGKAYLSSKKRILTILKKLDEDNPLFQEGYQFAGRFQGAVNEEYFTTQGHVKDSQYSSGDLVREVISGEDIVNSLWNVPGQSMEQILKKVYSREERLYATHTLMDKLISSRRVSVLRFTTYAPSMKTTFFHFATEHGRLEIIDNKPLDFAGFQIGHTHDPMGQWDEKMKAALEES